MVAMDVLFELVGCVNLGTLLGLAINLSATGGFFFDGKLRSWNDRGPPSGGESRIRAELVRKYRVATFFTPLETTCRIIGSKIAFTPP
jgi:hypothetical protein